VYAGLKALTSRQSCVSGVGEVCDVVARSVNVVSRANSVVIGSRHSEGLSVAMLPLVAVRAVGLLLTREHFYSPGCEANAVRQLVTCDHIGSLHQT